MVEYVLWFSIGLWFIAAFILIFVWPMSMYNAFWVAVTNDTATLPVFSASAGAPRVVFYAVKGKTRTAYGLLCLASALSVQLAFASFIFYGGDDGYATPFQKYTLLIWVATNSVFIIGGLAASRRFNYSEIDQNGELFFWMGMFRRLRSMVRKD